MLSDNLPYVVASGERAGRKAAFSPSERRKHLQIGLLLGEQ